MNKGVYNYSESGHYINGKYSKVGNRTDIKYIGKISSKSKFIRICSRENKISAWIRDRTSETGNEEQINLALKYEGKVLVLDKDNNIIEILEEQK